MKTDRFVMRIIQSFFVGVFCSTVHTVNADSVHDGCVQTGGVAPNEVYICSGVHNPVTSLQLIDDGLSNVLTYSSTADYTYTGGHAARMHASGSINFAANSSVALNILSGISEIVSVYAVGSVIDVTIDINASLNSNSQAVLSTAGGIINLINNSENIVYTGNNTFGNDGALHTKFHSATINATNNGTIDATGSVNQRIASSEPETGVVSNEINLINNASASLLGSFDTSAAHGDDSLLDNGGTLGVNGSSHYFSGGDGSDKLTISELTVLEYTTLDGGDDVGNGDTFIDILTFIGTRVDTFAGSNLPNWEQIIIDGSTLVITDNALTVGTLVSQNGGVVSILDGTANDALIITGNYGGDGNLQLDVLDDATTDTLKITGDSDGNIGVTINDLGLPNMTGIIIPVVTVGGISDATFTLNGGPIVLANVTYQLTKNGSGGWDLVSIQGGSIQNIPTLNILGLLILSFLMGMFGLIRSRGFLS